MSSTLYIADLDREHRMHEKRFPPGAAVCVFKLAGK